jgi:Kef-type K+ transport system membrane component KefB
MSLSWVEEAVVFLAAAVITVPLFKKMGMGAVLGYLAAGVLIGPWLLGFVSDVKNILHFSELGVVLLLFVIGLELQPSRLWALRRPVFGLGSAQVIVTGLVLAAAGLALGLSVTAALVVGVVLSLSSTAFALQTLAEKKQLTTHYGRAAFAILLFQDLAAIPLLAIIPLLGAAGPNQTWDPFAAVKAVAIVIVVVAAGRRFFAWRRPRRTMRCSWPRRCSSWSEPHCSCSRPACPWPWDRSSRVFCSRIRSTATSSRPISRRSRVCCWGCFSSPWACPWISALWSTGR